MPLYEAAVRTTASAAAAAAIAGLMTAAGRRARLREIGIFNSGATVGTLGLARASTVGTASASVLGQAIEPGDQAAVASLATAWSVAPAIGANVPLRRFTLPGSSGAGIIFVFADNEEIILNASTHIMLWSFAAAAPPLCDVYCRWEE